MIKRIELRNFMSHEHTVIDLSAGLNVLVGPNNCGKSAVVAALQILCSNELAKHAIRHGAKECSVTVETDDGHVVEWSRKKSGSSKYLIDGIQFDRLNRGIPDQLHEALRLPSVKFDDKTSFDVHFGEQKQPVFLLNDKPSAAAQFFASSSDAIRLVEMQKLHKQNTADSKSEKKRLSKEATELEGSLEILKPVEQIAKELEETESAYAKILNSVQQQEEIATLIKELNYLQSDVLFKESFHRGLCEIESPPEFHSTAELQKTIDELVETSRSAEFARSCCESLTSLQPLPELEATDDLQQLIHSLNRCDAKVTSLSQTHDWVTVIPEPPQLTEVESIEKIISEIEALSNDLQKQNGALVKTNESLVAAREELTDFVAANKTCPTCGNEISADSILHGSDPSKGDCHA